MKVSPLTKTIVGLTAAGAAYVWVQKRKNAATVEVAHQVEVHGFVSRGYEAVREAFAENFVRRREVGAACCVYHRSEKVVDLWGGIRNKATGEPWQEDTMVVVFSPLHMCIHNLQSSSHRTRLYAGA